MASGSKGKEEGGDQMKERDWTPEEDERLLQMVEMFTDRNVTYWTKIRAEYYSQQLDGLRPWLEVRRRWEDKLKAEAMKMKASKFLTDTARRKLMKDLTAEVEHPDVPPSFATGLQADYGSLEDLDIIDAEWTEEDYAEATAVTPQQQQQQQEDEDTVEDLAAEVGHPDVAPPGFDACLYNSDYVSLEDFDDIKYEEMMEVEWTVEYYAEEMMEVERTEEDYVEATAAIIPPQHQQQRQEDEEEAATPEASKILKKAEDGGD